MSVARSALRVLDPLVGRPLILWARVRSRGVVLLYHRVSAEPAPDYPPLDPSVFREHLELLGGVFDVLPLSEFVDRLSSGRSLRGCCALTFDDGYDDFITDALPILTDRGLPVTHFLVADSVLTGRPPWNARLSRLLRLDPAGRNDRASRLIARFSGMRWADRDAALREWEQRIGDVGDRPPKMISRSSVGELVAAGVEIGSHTLSHCFLTQASAAEAERELAGSRKVLEDLTGTAIRFASYPQGLYDSSVEDMARRAGYRAAFAVRQRSAGRGTDLFAIPRFDVTDRPAWMLRMELSGVIPWLRSLRAP